jgi:hypothetical protein
MSSTARCNLVCDTATTATQRKIKVLQGPAVQSRAMRYAEYARVTPGLSTVHNKKSVFVSPQPFLPPCMPRQKQCAPPVCDWSPATKAKVQWLTGCPGTGLACGSTPVDNPNFRYPYPFSLFPRQSRNLPGYVG